MLRWLINDTVVDENTLLPGKEVLLEAYEPDGTPKTLQVYQVYSSAMRQILKHIGVPERRRGPEFAATVVPPTPPNRYRSDRGWQLPEPRGLRKSATYIFMDDVSEGTSGFIYTSRIGTAKLSLQGSAELKDPTGLTPIGVSGGGSINAKFDFARDPVLSLEVVTGTALVEHMLANLVGDVGRPDDPESTDVAARIALELPELRASLLDAYSPPTDWSAFLTTNTVAGDQGDTAEVALSLSTPSAGRGYFAVDFFDPMNPDIAETTDPWIINVDADLKVSVLADPAETELPRLLPV
jgi:hypothetical protein